MKLFTNRDQRDAAEAAATILLASGADQKEHPLFETVNSIQELVVVFDSTTREAPKRVRYFAGDRIVFRRLPGIECTVLIGPNDAFEFMSPEVLSQRGIDEHVAQKYLDMQKKGEIAYIFAIDGLDNMVTSCPANWMETAIEAVKRLQ